MTQCQATKQPRENVGLLLFESCRCSAREYIQGNESKRISMSLKDKLKGILFSEKLAWVRAARRWVGTQSESILAACGDAWWNGIVSSRAMPDTTRMFL